MRYLLVVCLLFASSSALSADISKGSRFKSPRQATKKLQPATNIFYQDPTDPCAGMTADECMASGGTTVLKCTMPYGCPFCAMNQYLTGAVCYRQFGQYGWCSCTALGTYVDKNGVRQPSCKLSGSCTSTN